MMRAFLHTRRVALAAALVGSFIVTSSSPAAPIARADGPQVWWVATTGTASSPAANGSSCANPSYVGATSTSIQAAINGAASGDEIRVCTGTYLVDATITVATSITITGEGNAFPILDGQDARRIVQITTGGISVSISKLHFQNGKVTGETVRGGAIDQHPDSTLTVSDSYFFNNRAIDDHGGAIAMIGQGNDSNTGTLSVERSTFYKNSGYDGGAIVVVGNTRKSTVVNSTFVANTAKREGGAVNGSFADLSVSNSTFIDNTAPNGGDNSWNVSIKSSLIAYSSSVTRGGNVCVFNGTDPTDNVSTEASCIEKTDQAVSLASLNLDFLAPWGGSTPTVRFGAGSTAIDAVDSANCPSEDQQGQSRSGSTCDAGAFEYQSGPANLSASTSTISLIKGRQITSAPTFTKSGLVDPVVYRVATELIGSLPSGVTISSTTGRLSGTPATTSRADALVVTATDTNGRVASARLLVDNCTLTKSDGAYRITDKIDLGIFEAGACGLSSDFVQTANIQWNGAWQDTSTLAAPFKGSYDGGGFSITGVTITGGETAFIAQTENARISNLKLEATVSGAQGTAGLIRYARGTTITAVHVSGTVTNPPTEATQGCVGGLVGETDYSTTITNSSYEGTVGGTGANWIGGLIGCAYSGTVVSRSYFKGTVKGAASIGGLAGWMELTEIIDSYATGAVEGSGHEIGGLVGFIDKDGPDEDVIALQGSYASVTIKGTTSKGALVGLGASTSVSSSFWEAGLDGVDGLDPIGTLNNVDGTQPAISATPAPSMRSRAFFMAAGWKVVNGWADSATSNDTWGICDGAGRPFLLWQHSTTPCAPPPTTTTTTTTLPATTTTAPPRKPTAGAIKLTTGGFAVVLGETQAKPGFSWSGRSKIVGSAGKANVTLMFDPRAMHPARRAWVNAGSRITLTLSGVKAKSKATVAVTSQSLTLGSLTANAKGLARGSVTLSTRLRKGDHRLRIQLVGAKGQSITVWIGIYIR